MSERGRRTAAGLLILSAVAILIFSQWWARRTPAPARPSFLGSWDACESDSGYRIENNPCRMVISVMGAESGREGPVAVRVTAASNEGRWRCWGEGTLDGPLLNFRWTGPKGWRGSTALTLDESGERFTGTYIHELSPVRQHAKGRRAR